MNASPRDGEDQHGKCLALLVEFEADYERRIARLIEHHAKVHGERVERLWELLRQRDKVREILECSESEWPKWQTGLRSGSRHEFLTYVLGQIAAVVFDDRSPTQVAEDAGMPLGLCGDRDEHESHLHRSRSLGKFWCTADQEQRLPYAAERKRNQRGG